MAKRTHVPDDLAALVEATVVEVAPAKPEKANKPKSGKKGTRTPMARVFIDGKIALVSESAQSVTDYLNGFLNLEARPKAGYDNFWTGKDGFTNAQKFRNLTPQGVAKMLIVLNYQAQRLIAQGGNQATEMQNALDGINEWLDRDAFAQAVEEVQKQSFDAAFALGVKALIDPKKGGKIEEEAREIMAERIRKNADSKGITWDAPAKIESPATTASETVEKVEDVAEGDEDLSDATDEVEETEEVNA